MDANQDIYELSKSRDITQSLARHRIGFGESVDGEGSLPHARQTTNAEMLGAIINQFFINFVGEHQQIVLTGKGSESLQIIFPENSGGWIVRRQHNQHTRALRNGSCHISRVEPEAILFPQWDAHRSTSRHSDAMIVV